MFSTAETAWKSELSYQIGVFSLVGNYLRPSNNSGLLNFNINADYSALIGSVIQTNKFKPTN